MARIPGRHHAGSASHWPDRGRLVTAPAIARDKIAAAGFAVPGTLTIRAYACGKHNCRCHADPPQQHGPYAEWTRKIDARPSPAAVPRRTHRLAALFDGSVPAENANLHQQNRRLAQQVTDLEDRLSELLGQQAFDRSGLSAPASTVAVHAELEAQRQTVLDLRRVLEERDEELAAARETNRRLMNQLSRSGA